MSEENSDWTSQHTEPHSTGSNYPPLPESVSSYLSESSYCIACGIVYAPYYCEHGTTNDASWLASTDRPPHYGFHTSPTIPIQPTSLLRYPPPGHNSNAVPLLEWGRQDYPLHEPRTWENPSRRADELRGIGDAMRVDSTELNRDMQDDLRHLEGGGNINQGRTQLYPERILPLVEEPIHAEASPRAGSSSGSGKTRPRHACPIAGCPYKSTKPTDVQRHLESRKHGEGVQYKCTDVTDGVICGQVIQGRPDNLIRHVVTQHGWDEDQVRTRIGPIMRDARDRRAANARSGANDREVRWAP